MSFGTLILYPRQTQETWKSKTAQVCTNNPINKNLDHKGDQMQKIALNKSIILSLYR